MTHQAIHRALTGHRHAATFSPAQPPKLLVDAREAATLLGVSLRSFHNLRQNREDFPKNIALGLRSVRWRVAELEAFIAALPGADSPLPEPEQLKAGKAARRGTPGACKSPAAQTQETCGTQQSAVPSNPDGAAHAVVE